MLLLRCNNMKITIYSTATCPYCISLKKWLDSKSIEYTSYDIEKNPIAAQNMLRLSNQQSVPFSTVEDNDGKITNVFGFDIKKFSELLKENN